MRKLLIMVAAFSVLSGMFLVAPSRSQQAASPAQENLFRRDITLTSPYPDGKTFYVAPSGDGSARSEVARLMHQLREADDAQKAELTKQLEGAVDKYFDEDMKARESELARLEERLTKLRTQLDRRRKAKAEIIQLQIKVLVNDAEGLGFSGASFFDANRISWPAGWTPTVVEAVPPAPAAGALPADRGYGAPKASTRTVEPKK